MDNKSKIENNNDSIEEKDLLNKSKDNKYEYQINDQQHSEIYHQSITQTLYRTTYTVLTTLIAPITIMILGSNDALEHIGIISTVGIVTGAYASIFLSAFTLYILYRIKNTLNLL